MRFGCRASTGYLDNGTVEPKGPGWPGGEQTGKTRSRPHSACFVNSTRITKVTYEFRRKSWMQPAKPPAAFSLDAIPLGP